MLPNYYEQCKTVNTLDSRSYYIPFEQDAAKSYNREDSARFTSLCGKWSITPYASVLDVADDFWKNDGERAIDVPSCVQYYGMDNFQYTNLRFPFPFDPPHIPKQNPAYHYTRRFDWRKGDDKAYIVFEGVDSCFYLYVNGRFVGFSHISHRISEFDITDYIVDGSNKVDVLVVKWCADSYLEDQDKWRFTGIFRDVYLLRRPRNHLVDYKIETDIRKNDGVVTFINRSDVDVSVTFNSETQQIAANGKHKFVVKDARLWSAETPYLYDMQIDCNGERIFQRVGISTAKIVDGLYLFNGKPIKFYGVNRHDFHPDKGAAVSKEDMQYDILLMKRLNVNAVRTSHYPSSSLFYEMCNEYGLYVISEADLESHGSTSCDDVYSWQTHSIAENKRFEYSTVLRSICNVEEHKNFACVAMWSLGNESGWGHNLKKAFKACKQRDNRPIHYESIKVEDVGEQEYYNGSNLQMVSKMYATPTWMKEGYLADDKENRPLILCEYAHAMGNGPGGMKEYWDLMESSPRFMGGFVWEWADHGVRYGSINGFKYGGDFGETLHDGNFCIDGLLSPDRKQKAGTLQMKRFYQPLAFARDGKTLVVFNKNYFAPITGELSITQNGTSVKRTVGIPPRASVDIDVAESDLKAQLFVDGEEVAREQFITEQFKRKLISLSIETVMQGHALKVTVGDNTYLIDTQSGEIESIDAHGKEYGRIKLNLWRASTDNDANEKPKWDGIMLKNARMHARGCKVSDKSVAFDVVIAADSLLPLLKGTLKYTFCNNGVNVEFAYKQEYSRKADYLPRVGFTMSLDKSFDKLKYLAYGKEETYCDMYEFAFKDEYESSVAEQYHRYVKPQESGSHYLPDFAELSDGVNVVRVEGMTSFSALPYSSATIETSMHDYELPSSDGTYLSVDYYMGGLGTNSCGPLPFDEYRVPIEGKGVITFYFDVKR